MASVSSPTFSPYADSASGSGNNSNQSQNNTQATDPLANESTFLTLLVSQLKNQNPASPMDGTTFVTQLAQFSDLEQNLAMRQDLDAISLAYDGASSTTANTTNSDSNISGTTTPSTGTQS